MQTDEVCAHLRTFTYPGWSFEIEPVEPGATEGWLYAILYGLRVTDGDVIFMAHFAAPESDDPPGEETTKELARPLVVTPSDFDDVTDLEDIVFVHMARVQLHELSELAKFGGRAPYHNHRLDGKRRLGRLARNLSSRMFLPL